jgi:hypothetical protein
MPVASIDVRFTPDSVAELGRIAGAAGCENLRAIEFAGNQLAVPGQDRVQPGHSRYLGESFAPQSMASGLSLCLSLGYKTEDHVIWLIAVSNNFLVARAAYEGQIQFERTLAATRRNTRR